MKVFLTAAIAVTVFWACTGPKALNIREADQSAGEDSVSYELVVLDPGFECWFLTRSKAANYHTQSYYEGWNQRYVHAWNYQRMGYRYSELIHGNIDYDPNTDYGLEINHKLFYYFMYVENELHIPLISDGPRTY